jgi:hypothetical protein
MLELRKEYIELVNLEPLRPLLANSQINATEFFGSAGKEHYKLLAYLSTKFTNRDIIDIRTHRGTSALALSYNQTNRVYSFDSEHMYSLVQLPNVTYSTDDIMTSAGRALWESKILGSAFILIDIDPHDGFLEYDFFTWLKEKQYEGFVVCDDIWYFKGMRDNFWYKIPTHYKKDLTELGHWSGTGIIQFFPIHFTPVVNETNYTIVTAYFDLTKMPDASKEIKDRPKGHYLANARATLSIDHNLVVFCEPENLEEIKSMRPPYLAHKTYYIPMSFEDFPLTRYRDKILENRKVNKCHDSRNTASYYLFCMSRYAMLKTVMDKNPFNSTHFAWLNICIERMGYKNLIEIDAAFNLLRDKVSTCYIDYYPLSLAKNPAEFFSCGGPSSLCSGFFTGIKEYMYPFCNKVETQFFSYLEQGYGHADEQLFCCVYLENPDMFDVYYADYNQMVTNYVWLKDNPSEPLNLVITHSFERGNFDVCLDGCKKMWRSYKQGYTNLNANEIVRLTSLYRACLQKKGLPAVLE